MQAALNCMIYELSCIYFLALLAQFERFFWPILAFLQSKTGGFSNKTTLKYQLLMNKRYVITYQLSDFKEKILVFQF